MTNPSPLTRTAGGELMTERIPGLDDGPAELTVSTNDATGLIRFDLPRGMTWFEIGPGEARALAALLMAGADELDPWAEEPES